MHSDSGPRVSATEPTGRALAIQIAVELDAVVPNQANAATIARCEQALQIIADESGSPLWIKLLNHLGKFLLESPNGNRAQNIARAKQVYTSILRYVTPEDSFDDFAEAASGLANALSTDPTTNREGFQQAFEIYEGLTAALRKCGNVEWLSVVLGNHGNAVMRAAENWGEHELLEKALALRQESVQVLEEAESGSYDLLVLGRAWHNLGAAYIARKRGLPDQNVDNAVRALQRALDIRTLEADPIGRVKTLRALAMHYPRWVGAESLEAAAEMGERAAAEARRISKDNPVAARRNTGYAAFAGQTSALMADLDWLDGKTEAPKVWFDQILEQHREAIAAFSKETMPAQWAEWVAGYARLLAKLTRFVPENGPTTLKCFSMALEVIDRSAYPRLWRDVQRRFGEFGHQIGNWQIAYDAYTEALAVNDTLFDLAGSAEGRALTLAEARGFALFAANAAARLGRTADAVRLAELGKSRSLVEAIASMEATIAAAPDDLRDDIQEARERVAALEAEFDASQDGTASAEMQDLAARLADHLGIDLTTGEGPVKIRGTRISPLDERDQNLEYSRLAGALAEARGHLREALDTVRAATDVLPAKLGAQDIVATATKAGYPIVYLLATAYGALCIVVPPNGEIVVLDRPEFTSNQTRRLVYGSEHAAGFLDVLEGDEEALTSALPFILEVLRDELMSPLSDWLVSHGFDAAALAPLGFLGLLPLHAALPDGPSYSYVPSARAWALALALRDSHSNERAKPLAVGGPQRTDDTELPLAIPEAHAMCARFREANRADALTGAAAKLAALRSRLEGVTHLHLACHAMFRPSDPSSSAILLTGEEELTLGDVMHGTLAFTGVRLASLSACQTAVHEVRHTPDEFTGFPSALLLTGIPAVVGSLWNVDDTATFLFVDRFYELLLQQGSEPIHALARAQRWLAELRADAAERRLSELQPALGAHFDAVMGALRKWTQHADPAGRPFASPDLWAGFVLVGA